MPPLLTGFDSWSDNVEYVVDKMTLEQVFSNFFDFLLPGLLLPAAT
jgi:hypothetical protein